MCGVEVTLRYGEKTAKKTLAGSVTPEAAERFTDIPAAGIEKLAYDYAAQTRAVLYG